MGMGIRLTAENTDGSTITVQHEAPKDAEGRRAILYLKPSGKTYVHPMYAFAKQVGAPEEAIRPAHRGLDGEGNEGVSDQKWIYDPAEAATLLKDAPERCVQVIDLG
jgi:hypothetical protein